MKGEANNSCKYGKQTLITYSLVIWKSMGWMPKERGINITQTKKSNEF